MQIIVQKKVHSTKKTQSNQDLSNQTIFGKLDHNLFYTLLLPQSQILIDKKKINITKHEVCLGMICDGKRK